MAAPVPQIQAIQTPALQQTLRKLSVTNYFQDAFRKQDIYGIQGALRRSDWRSLVASFVEGARVAEQGEAVARAFRDGAVAYWRRYKPNRFHPSRSPPSSTLQIR